MKKNQKTISGIAKYNCVCLTVSAVLLSTLSVNAAENREPEATTSVPAKQNSFLRSATLFGLPLLANDENLSIGLGVAWATSPFKGVDDIILPFPDISYQNGNFFIDFSGIGYTVYSRETCAITLLGSWRSALYESDDSSFLNGMEYRNFVIEGGAAISMETLLGNIGITALSDVTGNHNGQSVTAQYSIPFGGDTWAVEAVAGLNWQSKKMVDYYYGVRRSEVRDNRAYYGGKSTFSPSIGLNGAVEIYDNLTLEGGVNWEFLGSGITDSPLIDDEYVLSASLSLSYSF
jgi:outer membrane scaffolding protein for murein synthesis (MipA/OmpV family)